MHKNRTTTQPALATLFLALLPLTAHAADPVVVEREALFDWAELAYPRYFAPAAGKTTDLSGYATRYYGTTANYLGFRDGVIYATGSAFVGFPDVGSGVRRLGELAAFRTSMQADGFGVVTGEKLVVSEAVSKDANGGADWFELYNAGTVSVALAQYQAKDDGADRPLRTLPALTLAPGEYVVIAASETTLSGTTPQVAFNLGGTDRVQLYKQGVLMDELAWDSDEAEHGFSFARFPGPLSKPRSVKPTPGVVNRTEAGWGRSALGSVGTLSSSAVHSVALTLDPAAYTKMVETYRANGKKDWIEATVTINGTVYSQAGLRLKGNSSLRSITTSSDPATVPWLVKLDKFIKTQNHFGMEEFVVRSNNTRSALNEAVALELLELSGLATQDAIEAKFTVNGGTPRLRLVIESPDGEWMAEEFASTGALYKAESTGNYNYRGDDPALYNEVFDQEAGDDNADLTPLIAFLKFINQATDAELRAQLPTRLDVDAFAVYLAMQDLLNNFDDIDGPGNNSYLYYDTKSGQFTIVPWDYNLAFGVLAGGGGVAPGGAIPGGGQVGGVPTRPGGNVGAPVGGFGGSPQGRSNILVTRFLANSQWNALYQQKLSTLRTKLYGSGVATELLNLWKGIVTESGLVEPATLTTEAANISRYF